MVDLHPFFVYALMLVAISLIASAVVTLYKSYRREGYEDISSGAEQPPAMGDVSMPEQQLGDVSMTEQPMEGMPRKKSPQQDPMARAAAINAMASSAQPSTQKNSVDDKITEINLFILNEMINMLAVFTYVPNRVDALLDQSQELTDQTCQIVKEIEMRYVGRPKAEADEAIEEYKEDEPDDNLNDWTYDDKTERKYQKKMDKLEKAEEKAEKKGNRKMSQLKQKYRRKKKQFQKKHKNQPMLECFVGSENADISGADIFHVDKLAPITSFGPPIVAVTDLSGNIVTGQNLADAMKNKHIQENKEILVVEAKLLKRLSETNNLVKSYEYTGAVEKLKRVPITTTFSEQFVKKYLKSIKLRNLVRNVKNTLKKVVSFGRWGNKKRKKEGFEDYEEEEGFEDYEEEEGFEDYEEDEGFEDYEEEEGFEDYEGFQVYENKRYNFPVPYKDIDLNDEQRQHLQILSNAYELKIKIQIELGPVFNNAQTSFNKLSASYGKMSQTS